MKLIFLQNTGKRKQANKGPKDIKKFNQKITEISMKFSSIFSPQINEKLTQNRQNIDKKREK